MENKKNNRLLSLDVLRGITIADMILVNNPGSWSSMYAPLKHADWNGLTPTDLIFPFFMFIMGISTCISLRKFQFEYSPSLLRKILKRTFIIFFIGIGLSWFSVSFHTYHQLGLEEVGAGERLFRSVTNIEHIRILGVMQRLGLCYGITALIAVFVKHRYIPRIIPALLAGYFILLVGGNGFATDGTNILALTDQYILGLNHMFVEFGLDPEGVLSTIPSVCHVLIGFYCGKILIETKENDQRMIYLFLIGAVLTFAGFLLAYGCPVNKKIWSPTYVLVTCGMGASFLALLIWLIDVKGIKKWTLFFNSFGVNPLFIYVFAGMLATLFEGIYISTPGLTLSVKEYLYDVLLQPVFGDYIASLVYAVCFVSLTWAIGHVLYKKKIYIKI